MGTFSIVVTDAGAPGHDELRDSLKSLVAEIDAPQAPALSVELRGQLGTAVGRYLRITNAQVLDVRDVYLVLADAESARASATNTHPDVAAALLNAHVSRVVDRLGLLLLSVNVALDPPSRANALIDLETDSAEDSWDLTGPASQYGNDAKQEQRSSWFMTALALGLIAAMAASAYWSVQLASDPASSSVWARLVGPLIICIFTAVASVVALRQSASHRRSAREYVRLQRGLTAMPAYLAPLPPNAQHLVRATMTQSLFPRLLEDDDPSRQIEFPDSPLILRAIFGLPPDDEAEDTSGDDA